MIDALVTGAHGFIGRALVQRLQTVERLNVLAAGRAEGDVASAKFWEGLEPAKTVFHLAGRTYVPDSWRTPAEFLQTNVIGTEQALAYCRRHNASLVLASAYVYGIPERLPIHEEDPVRPNNPYALSKLMAEELCEFASRVHNVRAAALRLFNVYGPGQRSDFLIPSIVRQVRQGQEIRVLTLSPRRDYVFVDDIVEAMVRCSSLPAGFFRVNIGSGTSHSVAEVIEIIQKLARTSLPVFSSETGRPQEIPETVAAISHAADLLGWTPRCSFEEGIRQLFQRSEL
ncbi:MAG: NAD-dependent epimerase/dehydratase family protein [Rhodomicrobium sp.]